MRETSKGDRTKDAQSGVLAELPRARPQRASARRASARNMSGHAHAGKRRSSGTRRPDAGGSRANADAVRGNADDAARSPGVGSPTILAGLPRVRPQYTSPRRAAARAARTGGGVPAGERPLPRQGFESDPERLSGPIQPPGSAELAASLGELAGELAMAGLAAGARLLKDVVSRLPG